MVTTAVHNHDFTLCFLQVPIAYIVINSDGNHYAAAGEAAPTKSNSGYGKVALRAASLTGVCYTF